MKAQICPKCNGQGMVNMPPWIPGDQETYSTSELGPYKCNLCNGAMVIYVPEDDDYCRDEDGEDDGI